MDLGFVQELFVTIPFATPLHVTEKKRVSIVEKKSSPSQLWLPWRGFKQKLGT